MNAEISTREKYTSDSEGWNKYIQWIKLPSLQEIRTIDSMLNSYVDDCGDWSVELNNISQALESLPIPDIKKSYIQLKVDISESKIVPNIDGFKFLGIDLADETQKSSILNCGPWEGDLKPLLTNINQFGLLDIESAIKAMNILPIEWKDDAHSYVDIWAVYEKEH